jgi:predicted Zn-ribbon and HTH transcriptional regulator
MKFTFVDDKEEKAIQKAIKKNKTTISNNDNKIEKYKTQKREGLEHETERRKIESDGWKDNADYFLALYQIKINQATNFDFVCELIQLIKEVAFMGNPVADTYDEPKVLANPYYYPGFVASSVRQNYLARRRGKVLYNRLINSFNDRIFDNLFTKLITGFNLDGVLEFYKDVCKEHNATLQTTKLNLDRIARIHKEADIKFNMIPSACNDCEYAVNELIKIASSLHTILLLHSIIIKLEPELKQVLSANDIKRFNEEIGKELKENG